MSAITPPIATKKESQTSIHGYTLPDSYAWLRQRDTPEVLDYLNSENAYTDVIMQPLQEMREQLYHEMRSRIPEDDISVADKMGDYFYYSRTEQGKQYKIYCRRQHSMNAPEQIILDVNALAQGFPYFTLGTLKVSPDHRYLAYTCDKNGSEHFTVNILDMQNNTLLPDILEGTDQAIEWYNDSCTFLYLLLDHTRRAYKIMRHSLHTSQSQDQLLLHEPDEAFFLDFSKSRDQQYIFAVSGSKTTSECWLTNAADIHGSLRSIAGRRHDHEYFADSNGDTLYILTNDQAINFRMMTASVDAADKWTEFLPHRNDTRLSWCIPFNDFLAVGERRDGLMHIRIQRYNAQTEPAYISFPEASYEVSPGRNFDADTQFFRFHYSSPVSPASTYDYSLADGSLSLVHRIRVLNGFNPENYCVERHMATAPDGTQIPLTITRRRELQCNGQNPAFMVGYGSYGFPLPASFSSTLISLLDRGFVCVRAHIRGGGDMGEEWYRQGKLRHKRNTFTDFIACAEYLIEKGFTAPHRLAVQGGSAGGLLMGAIANMRPDLFRVIIASVPFVDLMNTMLDETLPLTVAEYEEWGNPNIQEDFEYMLSYSPYDGIKEQAYPHILAIGGYYDQRVSYWEPAKWVAKLRTYNRADTNILLSTKFTAGHFGASGRFDYLHELALEYVFILGHIQGWHQPA
jgi:oligopeptidase B